MSESTHNTSIEHARERLAPRVREVEGIFVDLDIRCFEEVCLMVLKGFRNKEPTLGDERIPRAS
jgi:hypothetical protein